MKKQINEGYFDGERPLFKEHGAQITDTTFGEGESPLKEARNIDLNDVVFKWKYPLWYDKHIKVNDSIFETMSRSGIWYTDDIEINNSALQAPKLFRRASNIKLNNVHFADAEETMWTCKDIKMKDVEVNGNYFGKDSENIYAENLNVVGNYVFDGAKNVEIHNSSFVSKDAFWNCDNVVIYDSKISGEYLAWNTKNITLINCTIESDQGLCYIDGLKMVNCKLLRTDLAFEYCSNIDAEITTDFMSIKNPISGSIQVKSVDEIIFDDPEIDKTKTSIKVAQKV
ncbi:hypothetical protein FD33_GL002013 [Companilactobacillus paralimentarius DSM 13238 = JCM 10415]|uniref:Hydrogenase-4 component C n=1 Tax=Companilactobacillus paralimentarius DSM 13238 = JCM 10415 TaxID=1122151 RepID=A0A0R1PNZ4_9LACO|nr:DUF3737 family protein [Companilactobacillus paralimentarius]KAE9565175.1 hydrogenase [Companilactobacillus paralimentarius]KRL31418.1 hypothetical protein FD33_GL002013 [Companilactobacillus paralimentarius DSM 13238 = JCM 10415]MDR4933625.1 DUF3737 family protein [Companilactobacillus paralimentarius]QFR70082.1 DUF3737 family protein [Companilactobacillus paralimentarius]